MYITQPQHKSLIWMSFFEESNQTNPENGRKLLQPINFQLEKLVDASNVKKKLKTSSDDKTGAFDESKVEFTPNEVVIIKELFDKKAAKGFVVDDADYVLSLANIFNGKSVEGEPVAESK